jgi:hypothetical protein
MPMPRSGDSAKPNGDSSSLGRSFNGSAEAHGLGILAPSRSAPPEHPVHDEGGMPVIGSSKEHNVDLADNKVTALRAQHHVR